MKKNLFGISLITMACLYGLLSAVILLVCLVIDFPLMFGIVASIVILILQFLISPFLTDITMKLLYGAKFNYESLPDYLDKFIDSICQKYKMKRPRIGYIEDGAPNAFTYGRTKNSSRIILTKGIFDLLTEEEVIAVVGHELGHATHYDMLFMTVAQLVPLVLYGIYISTNSDDSDDSHLVLVGWIAYVLYIICQYIILWLSRTREYYADSFAIEETKNPNALAEALVKIGFGLSANANNQTVNAKGKPKQSAAKSNALGIFDSKTSKSLIVSSFDDGKVSKDNIKKAMKWEMWNVWAKFYEFNSTHPLISKRLKAISLRCAEYNQIPYIDFDLKKPESYIDDFLSELVIKFLPFLTFIITCLVILILPEYIMIIIGIGGVIATLFSFLKLSYHYKNKNYVNTTVANLLDEVKVSEIISIPCIVTGTIIGRGNPGCILNEDFVIKDETGIMLLDYNQPINLVNKLFAIFKSKEYFEKQVTIKGWYRRSPVPYIEIYTMEYDNQTKKTYSYGFSKVIRIIILIVFIIILTSSVFI